MHSPPAEQAYLFRHAVVRDAAYELQPPDNRAALHAHVIEIVEELVGGDSRAQRSWAADLADHALRAQEAARTARLSTLKHLAAAELKYLRIAAKHAEESWRLGDTATLMQLVADHPLVDELEKARAQHSLGSALVPSGRVSEARTHLEAAIEGLLKCGDLTGFASATSFLSGLQLEAGEFDPAYKAISRMAQVAVSERKPDLLVQAEVILAHYFFFNGETEKAVRHFRTGADLADRHEIHKQSAAARVNLGNALQELGRSSDAMTVLREAEQVLQTHHHPLALSVCVGNQGWIAFSEEKHDEAERYLTRAAEMAHALGAVRDEAVMLGNLANVYGATKRFGLSLRTFERALHIHVEGANRRHEGIVRNDMAITLEALGRPDDAGREHEAALNIAKEMRNPRGLMVASVCYAETLARRGDAARAEPLAQEGLRIAAERKDDMWHMRAHGTLARVFLLHKQLVAARRHFDEARSLARKAGAGNDPRSLVGIQEQLAKLDDDQNSPETP